MDVMVTPAASNHAAAIAHLAEELDRFYGATSVEPLDARLRDINDALFADPPAAQAVLAWAGGRAVGLATYSLLWPAIGLSRSLYLKELYVAAAARRQGVGRRLMDAIFALARHHRCTRVEWSTDADNADARAFYDSLGLPAIASKIQYRVEGAQSLAAVVSRTQLK